jgi:hypothetical protein
MILEFNGLNDLLIKVEQVKEQYRANKYEIVKILTDSNVVFKSVEFGVLLEDKRLPEEIKERLRLQEEKHKEQLVELLNKQKGGGAKG